MGQYNQLFGQLSNEAKPQREAVSRYSQAMLAGGPESYRVAAPEINYTKRQFANARTNVSNNLPAGGQKNRAYRDLAISQPGAVSAIFQKHIQRALDRLTQLASSNTQGSLQATGGVSNVGNSLAQLAAQRAQAFNSGLSGLTGLAGFAFGGGFGGAKGPTANPIQDWGRG